MYCLPAQPYAEKNGEIICQYSLLWFATTTAYDISDGKRETLTLFFACFLSVFMLFVDDAFFLPHAHCLCQYKTKGKAGREREMDTGKTGDDEKRQDASIPDNVICFTMMYILWRQNKDSFLGFFFNEKRKPGICNLLTFCEVYTCVLFICVYSHWL